MRPHIDPLRRFYYVAILLVTSVGVFTFVLATETERLFAWTINPPLTAAFLGANYFAAFFLALLAARERVWAYAAIAYVVSVVFTTGTMLATLLHLDKFNFDNVNGWLWTIVYVTVPPYLVLVGIPQLRSRGEDPPRSAPIPGWLVGLVSVQAAIAFVVGVLLFVAPSTADDLWSWQLTPLTARTVAAWSFALAAGLAFTAWQRDWTRVRIATPTYVAIPVLQVAALARFSDTVEWGDAKLWAYVVYLAGVLVLGAYGLLQSWNVERVNGRAQAPVPAGR
ncbi:MAG: hypothetical protein M3321_12315 [Actinomycetota bacterium]|nr:hypothetical protein [Actinomycetota bacterium]